MKRIRENKVFLLFLIKASPKLRKILLMNASKEEIKSILEIVINTMKKNVSLNGECKTKLCKYKKILRMLSDKKKSFVNKRKILVQKGGFLPMLMSSLISGALSNIFSKLL